MRIPFGLAGRLALLLIALALLSQYVNYRSFNDLLKVAVHQRESDKIRAVSKIIEPRINHDAEWVKSVSRLLQNELSVAMQNKGPARSSAVARVLERAYLFSGVDTLEVTDEKGIIPHIARSIVAGFSA